MEQYIQISKINDFLFCPRSLYLHSIYESFDTSVYHSAAQAAGRIAHNTIDKDMYSSKKRYVVGIPVTSSQHGITGKIDIYDTQTKTLIERKRCLKKVFDGHKYQLYAEMLCLREMGYTVDALKIHSLEDNKTYPIALPTKEDWQAFFQTVEQMKSVEAILYVQENLSKCAPCIYRPLCRGDMD